MNELLSHIILEARIQHRNSKNPMLRSLLREFQGIPDQLEPMLDAILAAPVIAEKWKDEDVENSLDPFTVEFDMYSQVKEIQRNFIGPESYFRLTVNDLEVTKFQRGREGVRGEYNGHVSELNKETGLLDYTLINVRIAMDRSEGLEKVKEVIRPVLAHELLHAFEDYNRRLGNGERLTTVLDKHNYNRERDYEDRTFSYLCNYFLDPVEQRAFIAEFCVDIQQILQDASKAGKFKTIRDLESVLYLSKEWKRYDDLRRYIYGKRFYSIKDPAEQREYVNAWNRMVSKKGETFSRPARNYKDFLNKFFLRWEKFDDRLKRRVSQVVSRNLTNFSSVD